MCPPAGTVTKHAATAALVVFALIGTDVVRAAPSTEKAASTMNELRDHFSSCFQPPQEAAGSRVTFYFSLNTKGQVLGPPRATWLGFKGGPDEKARRIVDFKRSFGKCLPLSMSDKLAATIPGKVYFLQYVVADTGRIREVLLRPFGSHYFGDGYQAPSEPEPLIEQQTVPPVYFPSRARPLQPPPRIFRPIFRRFPPFIVGRGARPDMRPLPSRPR